MEHIITIARKYIQVDAYHWPSTQCLHGIIIFVYVKFDQSCITQVYFLCNQSISGVCKISHKCQVDEHKGLALQQYITNNYLH